MDQQTEISSR